jgi:hypothetical protein
MPLVAQMNPLIILNLRDLYKTKFRSSVFLSQNRIELTDSIFQNIFNPAPDTVHEYLNVQQKDEYSQTFAPSDFNGTSSFLNIDFKLSKIENQGSRQVYNIFDIIQDIGGFQGVVFLFFS